MNSILPEEYNDEATAQLTRLTTNANISVREIGYKPYIAPGVSSVALTIPEVIAGSWNDSARFLNGVFFGARNRGSHRPVRSGKIHCFRMSCSAGCGTVILIWTAELMRCKLTANWAQSLYSGSVPTLFVPIGYNCR